MANRITQKYLSYLTWIKIAINSSSTFLNEVNDFSNVSYLFNSYKIKQWEQKEALFKAGLGPWIPFAV